LAEQVLSIRQRVLGKEHPDTSISAWNLLATLLKMEEVETAVALLQSALLWLIERDPLSLSANQWTIRGYISQIHQQSTE
jgi:competence protein ComGF